MRLRWIFLGTFLLLSACMGDAARDRSLAGLDLSNMELVRELGEGLNAADRGAFSTYVAIHAPSSPTFCGEVLVGRDGRQPLTIGEAIDMTRLREFEIQFARAEEAKPLTPAQAARRQIRFSDDQRGMLSDQQTILFAKYGSAAARTPEWAELERRKADYDRQIAEMRAKQPFGPQGGA